MYVIAAARSSGVKTTMQCWKLVPFDNNQVISNGAITRI